MKSLLRSLCAVVASILSMATGGKATAQPSDAKVVVVDVSRGRSSEARLIKSLNEHLQRSGLVLTEGSLSASDRACEGPECLAELAMREGAGIALTAKIQDGAAGTYFITMALFDVVHRAPLQETGVCDQCTSEQLGIRLNDVADKLLRSWRDSRETALRPVQPVQPVQPVTAPATPVALAPLEPVANPDVIHGGTSYPIKKGFFAELSPRRKILAGVLGGLAGATLITSIALSATHGQYTSLSCNPPAGQMCRLDNMPLFATGFALTGALAIGVGITLFWPERSKKPQFYAEVR